MSFDLFKTLQEKLDELVLITFSEPHHQIQEQKVTVKPVLIKNKLLFQVVSFENTKSITKNVSKSELIEAIKIYLDEFKSAFFRFKDFELHVTKKDDGTLKIKKKELTTHFEQDLSHNRKKNYLLDENVPLNWLYELKLQKKEGGLLSQARDKFIQVNRFLEIIEDILPKDSKNLHIVDVGCGKGYLTFALYHFLKNVRNIDCEIIGIDLKEDVVAASCKLAKEANFANLHFVNQNISNFAPEEPVDMVISLHACDTATCHALHQAVKLNAKMILATPCCQHELQSQIDSDDFSEVFKHGLFRERFAALLTDFLRVSFLEALGYRVQVIEFVDPEHTPKNLLIRAVKKRDTIDKEKLQKAQKLSSQFNVDLTFAKLLRSSQII